MRKPQRKSPKLKKLTDAERYKRFLAMAKEVGASEKHEDFDKAFHAVTSSKRSKESPR